jgi:hypothetical protein
LDENFLRQIFRFHHVAGHAQAQRIYPPVMTLVKLLEGLHVTSGGSLRQLKIRTAWCLCFVRGHLPPAIGKKRLSAFSENFPRYDLFVLLINYNSRFLVCDERERSDKLRLGGRARVGVADD